MTENEVEEIQADLMTPEDMALLKKLQAKCKMQKAAMSGTRDELFQSLTENFGAAVTKAKKNVVSITSKVVHEDGNQYTITLGVEEDKDAETVDVDALVAQIVTDNQSTIDSLMGLSNSVKIAGSYEGRKMYWLLRKKAK